MPLAFEFENERSGEESTVGITRNRFIVLGPIDERVVCLWLARVQVFFGGGLLGAAGQ